MYTCSYKTCFATDYGGYPVSTPSHIPHQTSDHCWNNLETNEICNVGMAVMNVSMHSKNESM